MDELVKLITENGIAVICVAFIIYLTYYIIKNMNTTLTTMTATLQSISDRLEILEKTMLKKKNVKTDSKESEE